MHSRDMPHAAPLPTLVRTLPLVRYHHPNKQRTYDGQMLARMTLIRLAAMLGPESNCRGSPHRSLRPDSILVWERWRRSRGAVLGIGGTLNLAFSCPAARMWPIAASVLFAMLAGCAATSSTAGVTTGAPTPASSASQTVPTAGATPTSPTLRATTAQTTPTTSPSQSSSASAHVGRFTHCPSSVTAASVLGPKVSVEAESIEGRCIIKNNNGSLTFSSWHMAESLDSVRKSFDGSGMQPVADNFAVDAFRVIMGTTQCSIFAHDGAETRVAHATQLQNAKSSDQLCSIARALLNAMT
jgi:hypothetical protein